jgi:hypothetical protein
MNQETGFRVACARRLLLSALLAAHALLCSSPARAQAPDSESAAAALAQATLLLDTYYGSDSDLRRAGELISGVLDADDRNAAAYVQAARLVVKGGHIVSGKYVEGTAQAYGALLDRALALDPANQKALILKAEACNMQQQHVLGKLFLDKAAKYGEKDVWLWMGYARYFHDTGDKDAAYRQYLRVEQAGPGTSPSQRRAYTSALLELAGYDAPEGRPRIKELAAKALRERYPTNAWVVGDFAGRFISLGMFDDAIFYAREALRTMDYGVGRLNLAVALYGKAAGLILSGRPQAESDRLIAEAQALGVSRKAILDRLERTGSVSEMLMPTLRTIVQPPAQRPGSA